MGEQQSTSGALLGGEGGILGGYYGLYVDYVVVGLCCAVDLGPIVEVTGFLHDLGRGGETHSTVILTKLIIVFFVYNKVVTSRCSSVDHLGGRRTTCATRLRTRGTRGTGLRRVLSSSSESRCVRRGTHRGNCIGSSRVIFCSITNDGWFRCYLLGPKF